MSLQLIIMKGLPASGKTTWARKWVDELPKKRIRVNRDDIRRMLGPYWVSSREKLVTAIENHTVLTALISGYSVVLDATNFRTNEDIWKKRIENLQIENTISIIQRSFTNVEVEECIKRDGLRPENEQVGKDVIIRMANKYLNYNNGEK